MQPSTFYMWWKGAQQSRDFWVETAEWMVRVHVVPRLGVFDPAAWNTTQHGLKERLLGTIGGQCSMDVLPCHGEGLRVVQLSCEWKVPEERSAVGEKLGASGLWVGRSRFKKIKDERASSGAHVVERRLTMEDEEGGVGSTPRGGRGGGESPVDGPRAQADAGGVQQPEQVGGARQDQEHGAEDGQGAAGPGGERGPSGTRRLPGGC